MAYVFTKAERYAIFTVHREVCWLCGEPVGLSDLQVDHIVPERLEGKPELEAVKRELGLPSAFQINSFENWMPAHVRCNRTKGGHVFSPTPLIQGYLERAARKAADAAKMRDSFITNRKLDQAIEMLLHADQKGTLSTEQRERIGEFAAFHDHNRRPDDRGKPLLIGPGLTVVRDDGQMLLVRGPTGLIGARPKGARIDSSWDCPNCGVTGWNGAKCVICGMLNDE